MACINPIPIINDGAVIHAPCNKCRECKIQLIKDWSFRLQSELKHCYNAYFVTLTYEANIPELSKSDLRLFLKRLKNFQAYRHKKASKRLYYFKYLAVGEYGEQTNRPHYHLILFNYYPKKDGTKFLTQSRVHKELFDTWGKGITHIGTVTEQSINYVCKYVFKQDKFKIASKYIGQTYVDKMKEWHVKDLTRTKCILYSKEFNMPSYIKRKIFNEEQRKYITESNTVEEDIRRLEKFKDAQTSYKTTRDKWETEKIKSTNQYIKNNEKQTI